MFMVVVIVEWPSLSCPREKFLRLFEPFGGREQFRARLGVLGVRRGHSAGAGCFAANRA